MADHRLVPRNKEAEEAILAGCMMGCRSDLVPGDFHSPENKLIYKCLQGLWNRGVEPDLVLITEQLRTAKMLKRAGGVEYLARLVSDVPTVSQSAVDRYAEIVRDKALLRNVIKLSREMQQRAYDQESSVEIIGNLYSYLSSIGDTRSDGFYDYTTLMKETYERIKARMNSPQDVTGVPSPWKRLNTYTNGFQPSDLIIVAGRPGMGKSALASQIADYCAQEHGPALVYSLEMSREQWGDRTISREARVDSRFIRTGKIDAKGMERVEKAINKVSRWPVSVDDTPGLSAEQILLSARKFKAREGGLSMIVVDYLQLMRSTSKDRRRDEELGEITRLFKLCAKELNIPVVLLAQLNRKPEERDDKRPLTSDLRESGNIEQDADVILFLYRDDYYNKESDRAGQCEVIVSKQRNGPTGTVHLAWQGVFTRFSNLAEGEEPDDVQREKEEQLALDNTFVSG